MRLVTSTAFPAALRDPRIPVASSCFPSATDMNNPTANFAGLRVGAFESRRAEEMARLITRLGGVAACESFHA